MSIQNKIVERILAGVGGGGHPMVDVDTELPTIKGGNPTDLAGRYMEYVRRYFNETANKTACVDNGIIYEAEIDIFSMQELFKKALSGYAPDKLYYFNANHLGSGSLITDKYGQTYQTLIYAPHGEVLLNKFYGDYDEVYKFTGYEKDNESGLNYASARYQDPNIGFNSTDAKWYLSPHQSSYIYAGNNPLNAIDPDGNNPVYTSEGVYKGNTQEGFTGDIIIYDGQLDFSNMDANTLLYDNFDVATQRGDANTYDRVKNELSDNAKENIINNVIAHAEGMQVYNKTFSMSDLIGGKVSYNGNSIDNWITNVATGKISFNDKKWSYEATVENIQSSAIVHEWLSHKQYGQGSGVNNSKKSHRLAYQNVINYKALWNKTTENYKRFNLTWLQKYTSDETGRKQVAPLYRNLYKKYAGK